MHCDIAFMISGTENTDIIDSELYFRIYFYLNMQNYIFILFIVSLYSVVFLLIVNVKDFCEKIH